MVYNDCELVVTLLKLSDMVNNGLPPVCLTWEARVMANGQQVACLAPITCMFAFLDSENGRVQGAPCSVLRLHAQCYQSHGV